MAARCTWGQQRGGCWYQSQPKYIMAWEGDMKVFLNVAFQQPRIHNLDHCAVVATILRGRMGWLKKYLWSHQKFPLQLPPVEEKDQVMQLFRKLQKEWVETDPMMQPWNHWISTETWRLITHRAILRCTSHLCQTGVHHLYCQIGASLHKDWVDRTARVGASINAELAGGKCPGGFHHLKAL